jgi:hypothetical protein
MTDIQLIIFVAISVLVLFMQVSGALIGHERRLKRLEDLNELRLREKV